MPRHLRRTSTSLLAAFLLLAPATIAASKASPARPASLRPLLVRVGTAPAPPRSAHLLAPLPGSSRMRLDVVLSPRHAAQLGRLATSVSTPGSPQYRHFLARGAFARRVGPGTAAVRAVSGYLRRHGLEVTGRAPDGMALEASGPASSVERAFSVELGRYRLAGGGDAVAATTAPLLPRAIAAHVTGVVGLGAQAAVSPALQQVAATAAPAFTPAAPPATRPRGAAAPRVSATCQAAMGHARAGYTLDQLAGWYGYLPAYAAGDGGAGVKVALIEFAPYSPADVATFDRCYGLPAPSVTSTPVDGGPSRSYSPSSEVETELDLELVHGLAPGASILLYEGTGGGSVTEQDAYDAYARAVSQDRAAVITTSWGSCEPALGPAALQAEHALFEQAALQGQTVVAAAGDVGSEDCYGTLPGPAGRRLAVDDPASQPYVTGVGGTDLRLASGTEVGWNTGLHASNPGAGGGGVSSVWRMPGYQRAESAPLAAPGARAACGGPACREVPDVSADAGAPIATYCSIVTSGLCGPDGWSSLGGTSGAAPIWSALFALADAEPACGGRVGFTNPALYAIAAGSGATSAFRDVTSGDNDLLGTAGGLYPATAGYDMASGLGTPIAGSGSDGGLLAQLCSAGARAVDGGNLPPPVVSSLSPRSARDRGGAHIVVTGSGFEGATSVRFGAHQATAFRVTSPTRLVAVSPPGSGTVEVVVTTRRGSSRRTAGAAFRYVGR